MNLTKNNFPLLLAFASYFHRHPLQSPDPDLCHALAATLFDLPTVEEVYNNRLPSGCHWMWQYRYCLGCGTVHNCTNSFNPGYCWWIKDCRYCRKVSTASFGLIRGHQIVGGKVVHDVNPLAWLPLTEETCVSLTNYLQNLLDRVKP